MTNIGVPLYLQETKDQYDGFLKLSTKVELDEKNVSVKYQDHELDFKKISSQLPVLLDALQPQICQKCKKKKSCSFSYKFSFQDYMHLINAKKSITPMCDQSAEVSFDSLHILSGTLNRLGFTPETLPGKCICKNVKQQKRVRSTNSMSNFNFNCSAVEQLENVNGSPSKWTFDSVEAILRRKTLRKFPILFESVPPDVIIGQASSPCHDSISDFTSSPFHTTSENSEAVEVPVGGQKYDAKVCHNRVLSSSSATSSTSNYSATCTGCFGTSALLHCMWDGNIPTFLFSAEDGRGEMLVASPMKINSSVDRALDYIYTFHSLKVNGKRSLNYVSRASSLVGRMKVSSSLCLDSGRSGFMETQFVFFGAKEDNSSENQNSSSKFPRGNGLSQKVSEIFRPSISSRHQIGQMVTASSQYENLRKFLRNEMSAFHQINKENCFAYDFRPHDELVAIVVKDYAYESTNQVAFGGWGLKFLQEDKSHNDNSRDYLSEEHLGSENSSKIVNVVVPAGYHGGPIMEPGGPSTIIERWKSLGHCDCGGWDAGCPLTVLRNRSKSNILTNQNLIGASTFELFIEGSKQEEPTVQLVNVRDDVYLTYFQPTLSPLQCFAIAVANIHSRTPALCPQL